jgi:superfamily I DNA/RNA helicase/mRNA-degrading endonuclease RelE of RelBE toxin-antitoxin system
MAQIAIASGVFPAFARLPRKAQRKCEEFFRKFTQDPKQASIHYEPIERAADKQLRSVRIGDDYRAIVRAPESGDVFMLLHVDHHDEAYRWAESKQTGIHPATGTMQLFDVDGATQAVTSFGEVDEEPSGPESAEEATWEERRLFSDYSDEQLFQGGVPQVLIPAVRAVYTHADLDRLVEHLPQEAADLLVGLAAGYAFDEVIEQILDRPPPSEAPPTPVDTADVIAALERPSTQQQFRLLDEDFDLDSALSYPLDVWRVYLHPRQRAVVQAKAKGPMRVTGAAGTGKTVVAMHRASHLVRDVFKGPDDRVLFTTFTTNLAHDIQGQLAKLLEPEELARVEVNNLDAWASQYLRKRGKAVRMATKAEVDTAWKQATDLYGVDGYDIEFCKAEWGEVIQEQGLESLEDYLRAVRRFRGTRLSRADRRKLWDVFTAFREAMERSGGTEVTGILRLARRDLEEGGAPPRYRAVVVDETQDFSTEALKLLRAIAGPERPNDLFLVGDAHQRIYGRPVPLSQCGINVRGRRSRELRLNYRTTAAICRWSVRTLGGEDFDDLDEGKSSVRGYTSLRRGETPTVRFFDDLADERDFITGEIQRLLQAGRQPEEICVCARTHHLINDVYGPAFARAGIDHEVLDRQASRHGAIRLATMHRVKGLEFPVVFVVGAKEGSLPYESAELRSDDPVVARFAELKERCLLYVASSRARDSLYVTCSGTPSPFLVGLGPGVPPGPGSLATSEPGDASRESAGAGISAGDRPDPPTLLGQSLDRWPFPKRLLSWASRTGAKTLGDLVAVPPLRLVEERNVGRKTVALARAVLEDALGARWEELARPGHASRDVDSADLGAARWDDLGEVLPDWVLDQPLSEVELPTRMINHCGREGLATIRELVAVPAADLRGAQNLGRGSVEATRRVLVEFPTKALGRYSMDPERAAARDAAREEAARAKVELWDSGLLTSIKAYLQDLDSIPRMIVTRRSGLGSQAETLESIAATLGVTRERIRQVEQKTLKGLARRSDWTAHVVGRFEAVAVGGAVRLEDLRDDPWWAAALDRTEAVDYFCERLFGGGFRIIALDDEDYLAKAIQKSVDAAASELARRAKRLEMPAALSVMQTEHAKVVGELPDLLKSVLWEQLLEGLNLDDSGTTIVSVGTTKRAQILKALQARGGPMRVTELMAQIGRCHLPDEDVLYLGRGIVGLKEHFPDFDEWRKRLTPPVVRIMEDGGPERQWSCIDLVAELREQLDLPGWLEHWHLSNLLRNNAAVVYLGRLRVALPGVADEAGRIYIHTHLEKLVTDHGEPIEQEDLLRKLRTVTDFNLPNVIGRLLRPPFVKCGPQLWGLLVRDLPGGAEGIPEALDEIEDVLTRRERGLTAVQVHAQVSQLSKEHAAWTEEMCLSLLRGDSRFRLSLSGNVGLADWETVRVPTRVDIVRTCMEEGSGHVTVEAIQDRIAAIYGSAPERIAIGQLANRFGGSLDGEFVVQGGGA